MSFLWSVDGAKTRWFLSFNIIKKIKICQHIWSPKYMLISCCEPRSPRVCEGPVQYLPLSRAGKGRVESGPGQSKGEMPTLPWPLGCSQPVLLHWSEGKVYTSHAIPGARYTDSTLCSEVGLRGSCLWGQKMCQWGLCSRRLPGHCIPSTLPSGCLLVLLHLHQEDSVPSSSFHPFPASSTPPTWAF